MNLKNMIMTMAFAFVMLVIVMYLEWKAMKRRQRFKDTRPPIDPRSIIKAVKQDKQPMTRMPERDERK